jgi:hypothetical protein
MELPMQTNLSNAGKVAAVTAALTRLRAEYAGRPDVQYVIDEALDQLPPASLALFYDLLAAHETAAEAIAA